MWRELPDRSGKEGFTLLELLIAMSLLALIFAALTGGLRFGTSAWHMTSARLLQTEDLQLVYRTLRRQISTAVTWGSISEPDEPAGSFIGENDRVRFVGPAPARAMDPGLFRLTLALVPDAGSQALTLQWQRLERSDEATQSENIEPILRGVRSIRYSYFGEPQTGGAARWLTEWRDSDRPPRLVRIKVEFVDPDRSPWPEMVIPIVSPLT
jgi:general secretion pathway protein J